jgi:lipopolysaccharide biosynthesis protein
VTVIENRGRDIYPFIAQMSKVYQKYDFVGHIHTKKSVENIFGNEWREYLYDGLIGAKDSVRRVFKLFEDEKVGIVFPAYYELLPPRIGMGSNLNSTNQLLERLGLKKVNKSDNVTFPAGSMFWARTEAIKDLFELGLTIKDFQEEQGQIDGTTAHALERVFGILPQQKGYDAVEYVEIPKR